MTLRQGVKSTLQILRISALFLVTVALVFAQGERGSITGTVADPSGAVVGSAPIKARQIESGAIYETSTTNTGNYALAELPAGWPIEVSYTYQSNGRLHLDARLRGHDSGIATDFQRENSLPDEELDVWSQFIETELTDPPR